MILNMWIRTCLLCLIVITSVTKAANLTRRQLIDYLLHEKRYDATLNPEFEKDYPTNVSVRMVITDIHSKLLTKLLASHLDPNSSKIPELSLDMTLIQSWEDASLDFQANSSTETLELDPESISRVWHPDTYFMNEKSAKVHDVTKTNKLVHINRNGTVVYSMRLAVTLICPMDLHVYPFDGQRCPLYIRSFAFTKANINYDWFGSNPVLIDRITVPKFNLSNHVDYFDYDQEYWSMGIYSTLRAEISINRDVSFYLLQVFVPNIMIVTLSWVSFWVDADAVSARVSLSVTCVLTMATQSSGTRQNLPPVSYVKAIDVWMFTCLLYVFAGLLEYAFVNVMLRRHETGYANKNNRRKKIDYQLMAKWSDRIARIAFPATFSLFIITFMFVCTFLPRPSDPRS